MSKNATRHKESAPSAPPLETDIEARLAALGPEVEVLQVELTRVQGSPAVRVFLDRPGGVDHALCARATDCLRDLLRDYAVEVSSPGPDRPLTKPDHYRRFVGRRVRVRTNEPVGGRRELKGELLAADDQEVVLAGHWGTINVPYRTIRRSNLVAEPAEMPRRR